MRGEALGAIGFDHHRARTCVHLSGIGCGSAITTPAAHTHATTDAANSVDAVIRRRADTPNAAMYRSPCEDQSQAPRLAWSFTRYREQSHKLTGASTRTLAGQFARDHIRANYIITWVWAASMVAMMIGNIALIYVPGLPIWSSLLVAFAARNSGRSRRATDTRFNKGRRSVKP